MGLAAGTTIVGYLAWLAALAATGAGSGEGAVLAAAQSLGVIGSLLVGVVLVRADDEVVGLLLTTGAATMLIPWTAGWLVFGAAWTAVGMILLTERIQGRAERRDPPWAM